MGAGGGAGRRLAGWFGRPTRRAWSLVGGALLLFLVGSNVQAGWLYVLGAGMIGAAAAGLVLPALAVHGLSVTRRAAPVSRVGDSVRVELTLEGGGRGGRSLVEGTDGFLGSTHFVADRSEGAAAALSYDVVCRRRGAFEGGEVVLSSGSPFGVGVARRRVFVRSPLVVHPRWVPIPGFPLLEAASTPHEPLHERRRRGSGMDFYGIREYRPGDSLRHVHWRSTARGGRLLVREYEDQPASRLAVVVDAAGALGEEPETTFEDSVSAAASLLVYALEAGHPVQLFCDSVEGTRHLFEPGRLEALDWLARLEAGGRRGLARVAGDAAGEIHRRSTATLVFPSSRRNAEEAPEAVAILQDQAVRVIAVVLSARSYAPGAREALGPAEEDALVERLSGARAIVYRVARREDLGQCLRQPLLA